MFAEGEYRNPDDLPSRSFNQGDCLIVHGNTEYPRSNNSLNKDWGDYPCSSKFSAVICQLKIDVHGNGGLVTTTRAATTTTATTTTKTTPTSDTSRTALSSVSFPSMSKKLTITTQKTGEITKMSSRSGRSLTLKNVTRAFVSDIQSTEGSYSTQNTTSPNQFVTLQTIPILDPYTSISNSEREDQANPTTEGVKIKYLKRKSYFFLQACLTSKKETLHGKVFFYYL